MKKIWLYGVLLLGGFMSLTAHADSAADYNAGYNAGYENYSPPDSSSSDDYFAGWNAGKEAADAAVAAQNTPEPSDQQ